MRQRVVVVGGGYAGVMAANRLARDGSSAPAVTMIDPGAHFTERIRLHQVLAGSRPSAAQPWATVLNSRVHRLPGRVFRIDATAHRVELESGEGMDWDWLIYAVGSGASLRPGPASPETVADARRRLVSLAPGSAVRVAGAGLTGLETAMALAAARPAVDLVLHAPTGLVGQSTAGSRHILRRLERLGIAVSPEDADLRGNPPGELVLDCTGFAVPDLAARSDLPVDGNGRLVVDDTLGVPGHPCIVGAGDASVVQGPAGAHLRMACATALPQGAHAADHVMAAARGLAPPPFDVGYAIRCVDLGAGLGHIQVTGRDDRNMPAAITGRLGGAVKEFVSSSTVRCLVQESRRPGRYRRPARAPRRGAREEVVAMAPHA